MRLPILVLFGALLALFQPLAATANPLPQSAGAAVPEAKVQKASTAPRATQKRVGKSAQPTVPTHAASVYLIRGFLGVFSLGMDRLNASLKAQGVKTRILGHTGWPSVVADITAEAALHPDKRAPIVIIGHSLGGNAALQASYVLGQHGVPVDLVVTVDPTSSRPISDKVKRYLNIYMANDGLGAALAAKGTGVDNDNIRDNPDLNRPGVNHFTMDENPIVQQQIMTAVLKALGRKAPASKSPASKSSAK
ncbi:alpha/beta fold hydrolase [Kaistia soli]|nr:hypothetical protein [Kaistia soli]